MQLKGQVKCIKHSKQNEAGKIKSVGGEKDGSGENKSNSVTILEKNLTLQEETFGKWRRIQFGGQSVFNI